MEANGTDGNSVVRARTVVIQLETEDELLWLPGILQPSAHNKRSLGVPLTEGQGRGIREKGMLG